MTSKLIIGCDLFLDLKLYQVPRSYLDNFKTKFPDIEIQPINVMNDQYLSKDIQVYWGNRITPEIISSLPHLKWIHFGSVGVNRAKTREVLDREIVVTNSKDIMTGAVTAHALALMTSLARGMHHCWRLRQEGTLNRETFDEYFEKTHELEGQVCLIVGYGQIGKRLAGVCVALGMNVVEVSRSGKYRISQLKEIVRNADYVINVLPLTDETSGVFNKEIFESMKKSSFFINVGRGENVNEYDLVQALKNKVIAGAGLDVFEKEPLSASSELWSMPEVILTPHIGGLTNRYWEKECKLFDENLRRFIAGKQLINIVDMANGY